MCFEPSYRAAIAALAPWLAELDGEPLRRGRDELAEGSGAVSDSRNAELLERAARQAAEAAAAAALAHSAAEAARAMGENDGDGDGDELELSDDSGVNKKRSPKKGPVDEALTRYKAKKAGKSHAKPRDTREVTFALTDETLQALDDDGVSTKAAEGSVVSTEPEELKVPSMEENLEDDEDEGAKAERKKAKKRDRKERERRRAEADEADAAVVDHELRLRRIERDLLRAASAQRNADRVREGISTQTSVSLSRGALAAHAKPQTKQEQLEAEVASLKSQVDALLKAPREHASGKGEPHKPDWQAPGRRATIPTTPPPVKGGARDSQSWAERDDGPMGSPLDDDVDVTTQGEQDNYPGTPSALTPSASPMKRLATAADREADLARKLAAARAEVTAERERHALETQRLKDDHARFVDASNVAVKDAIEARDVAQKSLSTHPASIEAGEFSAVNAERDGAVAAASELERTLHEVREEAASNLDALREMHARECELRDENLIAANNLTRKTVQDLASATMARDALQVEVTRVNTRVQAVEDEFRWALKESEEDKGRLTAEVEEMTRVARAALDGKKDAEVLAEELAEVCEQQRVAIEDMARDRRRAERAEADAAAARADVGEMQVRIRDCEKRTANAVAAERSSSKALDLVKDQKAQSLAAIAEIDGVRKQLELAHDNVRVKDAMLESQAELIKSLKEETKRNRDASGGAVKAAADAERLAVSRCNSLEDELRHVKKDLAGADAAIERLEKALEEVSAKRNAAEDAAADARKEIAERDQMLAYVSSEVESVKSMFAQREDGLRRERDDALAQLAERDEHDDELKAEARSAREDAAAARADAAEMAAAAEARVASIDARERAASDKVRRVESEMRALLQEVAQHKRQSQAKVQELMALI